MTFSQSLLAAVPKTEVEGPKSRVKREKQKLAFVSERTQAMPAKPADSYLTHRFRF